MENGITKHKGVTILDIPNEKYPQMVQVIKTSTTLKKFLGKKYVTLNKCITTVDTMDTERLIEKSGVGATKELQSWVVTKD